MLEPKSSCSEDCPLSRAWEIPPQQAACCSCSYTASTGGRTQMALRSVRSLRVNTPLFERTWVALLKQLVA